MNFSLPHLPFLVLLLGGLLYSIAGKKLTLPGALTGAVCGLLIYLGCGYTGFILMTTFFLLGTIATRVGRRKKEQIEIRAEDERRNSLQVLANAGMATLLAIFALFDTQHAEGYTLLLAAAFASATADTLSSELGMVYGKNAFHCLTLKRESRGLDGVISIEGTLAGLGGAAVIALIHGWGNGFHSSFLFLLISGAVGNYSDSVIGATLERKKLLGNDAVNFLSTLIAVGCCLLVSSI
ncbi:DUF92 domain-containing protein [Pedobacter sp. AW31-3R]|uniref:DUF92 domain-containing protein n=1 Tax=Pedobacter sp. AW31-3R TaxID=3445781 RepID=UPI003F9F2101